MCTVQISIVIPAHNASRTLAQCLAACKAQSYTPKEIIVVDDGSTDDTFAIAKSLGVKCLTQERKGPASARNAGANLTDAEMIAFTDSDCIPSQDWLEKLVASVKDGVGLLGGTYGIANPGSLLARMIHEEIRIRHENYPEEVDFAGSYNMLCRKSVFDFLGGFDESFSDASAEDNDFAYRVVEAGWKIHYVPDAVVYHYHPEKLSRYLRAQFRHGFWRVRLYQKHPRKVPTGDKYAGIWDLISPPLTLSFLVILFVSLIAVFLNMLSFVVLYGILLVLLGWHVSIRMPWVVRLVRRTQEWKMVAYLGMSFLRDLARGLGMLWGVVVWGIVRKALL